jgi:ankyrin repeat protein
MADDGTSEDFLLFNDASYGSLDATGGLDSTEFMFTDDSSLPGDYGMESMISFPHGLPEQDATHASPSAAFASPNQQSSPNSSGGSQSDGSSRRAGGNSSHTSVQGDCVMASDPPEVKSEWTSDLDMLPFEGSAGVSLANIEGRAGFDPLPDTMPNINNPVNVFSGSGNQQHGGAGQTFALRPTAPPPYMFGGGNGTFTAGSSFQHSNGGTANTSRDVSPSVGPNNGCSPTGPQSIDFDFTSVSRIPLHGGWLPNLQIPAGIPLQPYPIPGSQNHAPQQPTLFTIGAIPSKSRVETQIPILFTVSSLPAGVTKLHLPTHTISKAKLLQRPTPEESRDMLELHAILVCSSAMMYEDKKREVLERARQVASRGRAPSALTANKGDQNGEQRQDGPSPQDGGDVNICAGCVVRERKRAGRKKLKKPEDEHLWQQDERRRVVVFNTNEVRDWVDLPSQPPPVSSPKEAQQRYQFLMSEAQKHQARQVHQIYAPMRIACYCRHHSEKIGFQVIFTLTDWKYNVIAQAVSDSIMITDDHKTPTTGSSSEPATGLANRPAPKRGLSTTGLGPVTPAEQSQTGTTLLTPPSASRPISPSDAGPSVKKRKSSTSKIPIGLAMTPAVTPQQPGTRLPRSAMASASTSPTVPVSSLNLMYASGPAQPMFNINSFPPAPSAGLPMSFPHSSPSPRSGQQRVLSPSSASPLSPSGDPDMSIYSAPASRRQSRAPSPSGTRAASQASLDPMLPEFNELGIARPGHYMDLPSPPQDLGHGQVQSMAVGEAHLRAAGTGLMAQSRQAATSQAQAIIHKIVPNQGSKNGGMEVTLLGAEFQNGMEVMFGDTRATTTTFWGQSCLVALVPPSPEARTVNVTIKDQIPLYQQQHHLFTYIDDDEHLLMRTALAILANKANGQVNDVRDIARKLIDSNGSLSSLRGSGPNGDASGSGHNTRAMESNLESQLLKVLWLIEHDKSPHEAKLSLRRTATGQTMLHLASSLGLVRFAEQLLKLNTHVDKFNALVDMRDRGGYTSLHLAALNSHTEMVKLLIHWKADSSIRSLSGLTAADLARSDAVLRALEDPVGPRNTGMLSAVGSTSSLRSLLEPTAATSMLHQHDLGDVLGSDEESLEYSSIHDSDEDGSLSGDFDGDRFPTTATRPSSLIGEVDAENAQQGRFKSPMTLVKEQFGYPFQQLAQQMQFAQQMQPLQQLQQALRQLPQMPYIPQMPNMPNMLPEQAEQVLARLSAMAANQFGQLKFASSEPPPSYEEVCPERRDAAETKEASAARAALEAEGDAKCAALFDTVEADAESSTVSSPPLSTTDDNAEDINNQDLPTLLQIGRKNAITKEQQENLRTMHAMKLKGLGSDRKLFFIWIPLLVVVMCLMLSNKIPFLFSSAKDTFWATLNNAQEELQQVLRPTMAAVQNVQDRVAGVY